MSSAKVKLNVKSAVAPPFKTEEKTRIASHGYHAPELHVVGKAGELVQGGGGGNYLDANRSRYY